ncbi:ATP-binding protein [Streptomyces shenzhenensis]|uniref:ATP-binding protein n=1 Tax=Streptomyces shenzhenensis TaxID=943815 RepID=UPI0027E3F2DE|nr:ATP-binding protein [Streptomyces shenzhenensis]
MAGGVGVRALRPGLDLLLRAQGRVQDEQGRLLVLDLGELGSTGHITRAPVRLAELVDSAVSPYRHAAERAGPGLRTDADDAAVDVDARWPVAAIGNVVDNALRHGRGDVRVTTAVHDGSVRVRMDDDGPGFPPAATNAVTATATTFSCPAPAYTAAAISTVSPGTGTPKSSRKSRPPTAAYPQWSSSGARSAKTPGSGGAGMADHL